MKYGRASHGITITQDQKYVVVAGGYASANQVQDTVEKFDIQNNNWVELPRLNEAKASLSLLCFNNRDLYSFGGLVRGSSAQTLNTIERLNLVMPTKWTRLDVVLPWNACDLGCVQIDEHQILIMGGWN